MSEQFNLIAAKLEEAKARHRADLNRQLFSGIGAGHTVLTPNQWRRVYWRVKSYVSTLWDALRGRDPYDVERDIDW
jgi:hypothetical protein